MIVGTVLLLLAITLLSAAILYTLVRWLRAPAAMRGIIITGTACFFAGVLLGIWLSWRTIAARTTSPRSPEAEAASRGPLPLRVIVAGQHIIFMYDPFASTASGDLAVMAWIGGPQTELSRGIISDIAADKAGNIYVLRGREVLTFPAGSKGDVLPASIIAGPATDLLGARNIAVTPDGSRIFIVSACGPENNACILSFPSNASGNIRPDSEISFSRGYGCGMYGALRLDPKGNVWVSDALNNCLSEVSANSSGAVEPTTTIWGSSTGLAGPNGFAFDQRGTLYVANRRSRSITVYQAGTREDASPIATIFGPGTKLMDPWSVAVDQRGRLYIAGGERLLQFNDRDAGDVMPKRESKLSNTGPSPTIVILD